MTKHRGTKAKTTRGRKATPKAARPSSTSTTRSAKKATAKKRAAKKATAKKRVPKKATAKKRAAKKATAKKRVPKKATVKKRVAKKATAKKRVPKKATVKKRVAKKATATKRSSRTQGVAKKSTAKKRTAKKDTTTRSTAKRRLTKARKPARVWKTKPKAKTTTQAGRKSTKRLAPAPKPSKRASASRRRSVTRTVAKSSPTTVAQTPDTPPIADLPEQGAELKTSDSRSGAVRLGRLPPREGSAASSPVARPVGVNNATWKAAQAIAERLGASALTDIQKRVISAGLEGRNVVATLAAGEGKSTCAAIAAQLCGGVAIVLSPSPRLTREQQQRLEHRRIPSCRLDPSATAAEQSKLSAQIQSGQPTVLFTTLAALASADTVRDALRGRGVALCIVEEAQALAESSHTVCPSLLAWRKLLADLGRPNVIALLAPSGFTTRREVADCLELSAPVVIESEPVRDNILIELQRVTGDARKRAFCSLVQELRRPGLVLAQTPEEVEEIHGLLLGARVPAHRYHAELSGSERLGEQLNFMLPGRKTVMVAQSAFGPGPGVMGIEDERLLDGAPDGFGLGLDKRDLRFVVHWGAPANAEQLAREIGAIGRDGDDARAIVYCDEGDTNRNGALLMRHRLHPPHATALANALDGHALESRKTNFEALALETGLSLATLENWCTVFEMAGLLRITSGWVETLAPSRDVMERATEISARLWRLQSEDERRLNTLRDVMLDPGCQRAALERALGTRSTPCGRCQPCLSPSTAPAVRRSPAQTFSVTSVDATGSAGSAGQLSAKVAEFDRLATGTRTS